jgi:endonuclease YncB( thermonuclease family)
MPPAAGTLAAADRIHFLQRQIRRYAVLVAVGLLWLGTTGSYRDVCASPPEPYHVLRVYDGDTILVAGAGKRSVIRLLGIDAPETSKGKGESGQPFSKQARRYLAGLILDRTVTLAVYGEDRYHRVLAVVYYESRDINHAMIEAGLAEVYRGRTPEGFAKAPYLATEAEARETRTGMWQQGDAYVSPIRWKHPR